ncbi:MAG TPA: M23 family peptidase, partial [Lachnoclostridium sp.]|nr:M23 family peptidase [Lachnoclostridium sp.]
MMVILLFILILSVFQVTMIDYLYNNPTFYQLDAYTWESDDFRSLQLGKMVAEWDSLDYDTLTSLMVEHQYDLTGVTDRDTHT